VGGKRVHSVRGSVRPCISEAAVVITVARPRPRGGGLAIVNVYVDESSQDDQRYMVLSGVAVDGGSFGPLVTALLQA